ncbi:MAG: FAD-binding oxidoreductase [Promethearchaeota archaeon]
MVEIFGASNVSYKQVDLYPYSYDATENEPHMPDYVVIAENKQQLVELVNFCNKHIIPIVPYISGNNLGGLTIPEKGGIIVDFGKKMNKILYINENMMYALLEPGVTFGQLKKYLDENYPNLRYSYPNAPPYASVVGNALLSGMTNMGTKIGSMGDAINGLEVILADGTIARIGSCFYGKEEADPDSWWCRYPIPDLIGLFVNWQGMTGLVTKCAVQLWPNLPVKKPMLAVFFGETDIAPFMREVGKADIVDDIVAFSIEVTKMELSLPDPKRYPEEPYFSAVIPMSARTEKMMEAKLEILHNIVKELNKKGTNIYLMDYNEFSKLYHLKARTIYELPAVILSLVEQSGLSWFGSYSSTEKFEKLIEDTDELFKKYKVPPYIMMKIMKHGHYGIFRPIVRYNQFDKKDKQNIVNLLKEIADLCIGEGCIPYKTPGWMAAKMREKINPGWLKLFEKIKACLDPNGIFNPGRWNT